MTQPLSDLTSGLTEAQKEAVGHIEGPVLVLAGPGSGKTTVVTRRVANLIAHGIPPWQILALTFTNKAAGEMRDRIAKLLPVDLPGLRGLTISTFHAFCARLLRRYASQANLSARFSIYDSADQREAIKLAIKEAHLDAKNWTPGSVAGAISNAKNHLIDAAAYSSNASDFHTRTIAKIYTAYQRLLRKNDALDFDDLLLTTAYLLRSNDQVRGDLQQRFQYIMIDEYQDTNYAQFVIAHSLAAARRNICVVGDPDQSIYGWRGADIRNILEFEEHYPNAHVIPLGQNFRSTGHIVQSAAMLIQNNRRRKHKKLHTELGSGDKPVVTTCFDEHHEARLIVDEFRRRNQDQNIPWREMAVLYRINALSRVMEEAFRGANMPYVIARGTAFYDRKEIKDALAYLRLVANPNDEVSLRRIINVPTRGIGNTTLDRIDSHAIRRQIPLIEALREASSVAEVSTRAAGAIAKFVGLVNDWRQAATDEGNGTLMPQSDRAPLAELVARIVRESGLEAMYAKSKSEEDFERLQNIEELINAAADFKLSEDDSERGNTVLDLLQAWLESVALVSDADAIDPEKGAVTLMTLHAAKGLEFEAVALAGLEEGLLPHSRSIGNELELEEERRLCFVGITRAKRHLLMTRAAMRTVRGIPERTVPSTFLRELPADDVIFSDHTGESALDDEGSGESDAIEWGRSSFNAARQLRTRPAAAIRDQASDQFPVGCLVQHPKFGLGRVEVLTRRVGGSSAQVAFASVGRKTLILEFAKLQRIDD